MSGRLSLDQACDQASQISSCGFVAPNQWGQCLQAFLAFEVVNAKPPVLGGSFEVESHTGARLRIWWRSAGSSEEDYDDMKTDFAF